MHKRFVFLSAVLFISAFSYASDDPNQENQNAQNQPNDFKEKEGEELAYTRRHKSRDDREDYRKGGRKFPKRTLPSSEDD